MPKFRLHKLSPNDGQEVCEMLQELPLEENRFQNGFHGLSFPEFQKELFVRYKESQGIDLERDRVPQTIFWCYIENKLVGYIKIRHYLNDYLKKHGGHIGYTIISSERGKGYGSKMLEYALLEARKLGIVKVLITPNENNLASRRLIEKNGGIFERIVEGVCHYWITI